MSFDATINHPAGLQNQSTSVQSHDSAVSHPAGLAPVDRGTEVDIGEFVKKVFASAVLAVTNTLLTATISVMKLTRFTIVTSLVLGHLSRPLHALNKALVKHTFTDFKQWSKVLGDENKRIIETEKVIRIENKKLYFNVRNYINGVKDSGKALIAPISVALSVANAVLWVAVKPLWTALFLPGMLADILITAPFAMNKLIGHATYAPLKETSDWMLKKHCDYLYKALPK